MDIKENIQKYIDYKGISINAFEKSIGCSNGYWRKTKSISANILLNIIRVYSELNIDWLISGVGEMIKDDKSNNGASANYTGNFEGKINTIVGSGNINAEKEIYTDKKLENKYIIEIELLKKQLEIKDALLDEKDKMIQMLLNKR